MKACNSCGKCCIKYSDGDLTASKEDLAYWENQRSDIHAYVQDEQIWFKPKTKEQLSLCPWLQIEETNNPKQKHYNCAIYYDRPEDCRIYPASVQDMIKDECEMLEKSDLNNLKQAEITLKNFCDS